MTTYVELVRRFRHLRALVIGDAMLDSYLEGSAARLCSEGPVPVVRKTAERRAAGGAANVAANVRALGAEVDFLAIVGGDSAGATLRSVLRSLDVDDRWLVEDPEATTAHKLRILADGQYVVRFDEGDKGDAGRVGRQGLLAHLDALYARCDVVIVSDYGYGAVPQTVVERLCELRQQRPCPLLIDSKDLSRFRSCGATAVTPNHLEAQAMLGGTGDDARAALAYGGAAATAAIGRRLLDTVDAEYAAITLAADGVLLVDRAGTAHHVPAHPVSRPNDVGAGDSFASAMALALAANATPLHAAHVGIDAAGIAVAKPATAVVQHQELLQRVSLRDHTRVPLSVSASLGLAAHLEAERAAGQTVVFTNGVFDILHAGHIEFLRQARRLGDVLVVALNSDRSVRRLKAPGRPITGERDRLALVSALDAVDHAVLFDEDEPSALIRLLRPHVHVKGGDYADVLLPEAAAVQDVGGRVVILPLVGSVSTSEVIERIMALAHATADDDLDPPDFALAAPRPDVPDSGVTP